MIAIRTAAAGRGAAWFIEGFDYVKPGLTTWVGIGVVLLILGFVSMMLPFTGLLLQLFTPVFMGGLLLGCRDVANGGRIGLNHLVAGFSHNTGNLLLVGMLYTVGMMVIMAMITIMAMTAVGISVVMSAIIDGNPAAILDHLLIFLLVILVGLLFYLPLLMAFWFAPALVVFDGQNAVAAMKLSFIGCVKNIPAFLVYGLVGLVLGIIAAIPLMLGWIILLPVTIAGFYVAYRDIYADNRGAQAG